MALKGNSFMTFRKLELALNLMNQFQFSKIYFSLSNKRGPG
jgi:hypothetical protein